MISSLNPQHSTPVPQRTITCMKAMIMQLGLSGVWRRFFWKLGDGGSWLCCFVSQSEERHGERRGRAWDREIKSANIHCRSEGRRVVGRMVCVWVSSPCARSNVSTSQLENSFASIRLQLQRRLSCSRPHCDGFFYLKLTTNTAE